MGIINPLPPYHGWAEFTPVIPAMYWDVYSPEERIKALCREYAKLAAYLGAVAETVNQTAATVNKLEAELPALVAETIKTDPEITETIQVAVADYIQTLTKGVTYNDIKTYGFLHDMESA